MKAIKNQNSLPYIDHELSTRVSMLEVIAKHTNETLARLDSTIIRLEGSILEIRKESWSQFRWIMGTIFILHTSTRGAIITLFLKSGVYQ